MLPDTKLRDTVQKKATNLIWTQCHHTTMWDKFSKKRNGLFSLLGAPCLALRKESLIGNLCSTALFFLHTMKNAFREPPLYYHMWSPLFQYFVERALQHQIHSISVLTRSAASDSVQTRMTLLRSVHSRAVLDFGTASHNQLQDFVDALQAHVYEHL